MTATKRWPSYRRKPAPEGVCVECWSDGGPPVAGGKYIVGWPSTRPNRHPILLCGRHLIEWRRQGWELTPVPGGDAMTLFLVR
jgi:hypothetical protein